VKEKVKRANWKNVEYLTKESNKERNRKKVINREK
jgi:hypothetical protein